MKIKFVNILLIVIIPLMVLSSCQSHEKKVDDAFDIYKDGKNNNVDSSIYKKTVIVQKFENSSEWTQFKTITINKIKINKSIINELKGRPNLNSILLRKAKKIEEENNGLIERLDEYQEEQKLKLDNFKRKMNIDINEIANELTVLKQEHNK